MFSGSNSLENTFILGYLLVFWRSLKITQPSFVLGVTGSFLFLTRMSKYIWCIRLSSPINIEMSLRTSILLSLDYIDVLLHLRHLGGSFIELTSHAFFYLNFSKFNFGKISKLTNLDWKIFFFLFSQLLCYTGGNEHKI